MRSTIGMDIDAPPDLVFAIAQDVTNWERILPHYYRSRVRVRHLDGSVTCLFVARRPLIAALGVGIPVAWRSRIWSDPSSRRLRFRHTGGVTSGMDVTWRVEPRSDGGTRVEIDHVYKRGRAIALPTIIDRWFIQPIAGRTLATFRVLAEAMQAVMVEQ